MASERAGGRRLAVAVLAAIGTTVLAGGLAAAIGYGVGGSGGGEFEDLGRALVGVAAAVVVGIPVLVASVVVAVRRTVVPGRRRATATTVLLAVVAVPIAVGWATEASRRAGLDALGVAAAVLVVAAAAGSIGAAAGTTDVRWALRSAVAAAASLALVAVAVVARADEVADQRRAARYERNGAPLALLHGTDLDAGFVGWRLQLVGSGHGTGEVRVDYEVVDPPLDGYRWLALSFEADPEPLDCSSGCEEVGRRRDGRPIHGRRHDGTPGLSDVWVDVDGGRWRVTSTSLALDRRAAVEVLDALEPVDAAAFVAGTEPGFNP